MQTYSAVSTTEQALSLASQGKAPSLITLSRSEGSSREKVKTLIRLHLICLNANAKVKQGLVKDEIELLAAEIVSTFYFLTFADIALIFRRFYLGRYGKLYGTLTSADVYSWFEQYANERCNLAAEQNREADLRKYGDIAPRQRRQNVDNYLFDLRQCTASII